MRDLELVLVEIGIGGGRAMFEALSHQPKESTESKDEFLAMVSHELRTPIVAILVWIELLDKARLDQAITAQAVEVIKRSAQLQVKLVEDLLDYSRITANKLSLTPRVVSLKPIIKAAIDAVLPMARKKLIDIKMEVVSSDGEIEGDSLRLQQVFSNLLSNAIKFTPSGGNVRVKLESRDAYHTVTVSDTGEGISAEFLPFIFDRYRQANQPDAVRGGLGLGLTITHHIVELHGGTIKADSGGKGQGAVFTIQLPHKQSRR
jgi:signal transduction histidine kinase